MWKGQKKQCDSIVRTFTVNLKIQDVYSQNSRVVQHSCCPSLWRLLEFHQKLCWFKLLCLCSCCSSLEYNPFYLRLSRWIWNHFHCKSYLWPTQIVLVTPSFVLSLYWVWWYWCVCTFHICIENLFCLSPFQDHEKKHTLSLASSTL